MKLHTIRSGGQTGTDQAGWEAAKVLGLKTCGTMPLGFKTEDGPRPEFGQLYGATEHTSAFYEPRTSVNVRESDATLILSANPYSGGTLATIREARYFKKPFLVNPQGSKLKAWLAEHDVGTLNVAGNRESKHPGIQERVKRFLVDTLSP